MPDALIEAREELATLASIQWVVGEVRFIGKDHAQASRALKYLEAKVAQAQARVDALTPDDAPPGPEVVPVEARS